jgi:hypothetical protein
MKKFVPAVASHFYSVVDSSSKRERLLGRYPAQEMIR